MAFDDYVIQDNTDFAFISGDVLYNVPDADYRDYVRYGLFSVDHHGALRFEPTAQIVATTSEQFDILMQELAKLRESMESREREPDARRAMQLMPERRDLRTR
jgi:hypothetical protein